MAAGGYGRRQGQEQRREPLPDGAGLEAVEDAFPRCTFPKDHNKRRASRALKGEVKGESREAGGGV